MDFNTTSAGSTDDRHQHGFLIPVPLTVKGKAAPFAVISMTADSPVRKLDIEGFYENPHPQK